MAAMANRMMKREVDEYGKVRTELEGGILRGDRLKRKQRHGKLQAGPGNDAVDVVNFFSKSVKRKPRQVSRPRADVQSLNEA